MNLEERMGTDFYINTGNRTEPNLVHIGKFAYGINFVIRCNPEHYTNFGDFEAFVKAHQLYNHFGNPGDSEYFLNSILSKSNEPSVLPMFKKAGKEGLVSVMQQYDTKGQLIAEYDCVNMDFHKDMTGRYLKKTVFDRGPEVKE